MVGLCICSILLPQSRSLLEEEDSPRQPAPLCNVLLLLQACALQDRLFFLMLCALTKQRNPFTLNSVT